MMSKLGRLLQRASANNWERLKTKLRNWRTNLRTLPVMTRATPLRRPLTRASSRFYESIDTAARTLSSSRKCKLNWYRLQASSLTMRSCSQVLNCSSSSWHSIVPSLIAQISMILYWWAHRMDCATLMWLISKWRFWRWKAAKAKRDWFIRRFYRSNKEPILQKSLASWNPKIFFKTAASNGSTSLRVTPWLSLT